MADIAAVADVSPGASAAATTAAADGKQHDGGGKKQGVGHVLDMLNNLRVDKHPEAPDAEGPNRAATLSEVAGIITTLTRDHLGSLLVHPGHATIGVYYLARRHEMARAADHIDGNTVGDKDLVQQLLRYVDISDSIYPDRYAVLVQEQGLIKESDILLFFKQVHKLQPGFFVALDRPNKKLLWVIRGTHDIHDLLTDLCGVATPLPASYGPGAAAHWGMWRAVGWLLDTQWETQILKLLRQHPGYELEIIGHSMGGGVGALLALRLNSEPEFKQQLGDTRVTCVGVASAACLSGDLAAACSPYVTTLVMRNDLVPRFTASAVDAMQQELLELAYKGLLHEDLMEHEVYRVAVERTAIAAERIKASPLARRVASTAAQGLAALQAQAAGGAQALAHTIDGAVAGGTEQGRPAGGPAALLQHDKVRSAASWVSHTLRDAAGSSTSSNQGRGAPEAGNANGAPAAAATGHGRGSALASFDDVGEAAEAAAAAAARDIVDVALYAPGRLLYVKPVDEAAPDEEQHFELVDGGEGARFKRIVLRSSCMADHFPAAYTMGLKDVLASMSKRQ